MFYIFGLGNPGEEYGGTRHNTGRTAVEYLKSQISNLKIGKNLKIIESGEFMNNSGRAAAKYIKSKKAAQNLIVVYDDLDLPLGIIKISYNKGSGGHKGVESIIKALKTREFTRIRIGISAATPGGKLKKPDTDKKVLDFILGKYKPRDVEILKKVFKKASEAVQTIVKEGKEMAMNKFN